jgi:cytochrome c oxidase subunit I+III
MTIGFGLVVIDLIAQLRYGPRVRRDPWRAATLEWAMPIPPAPYAFASIPSVDTPADRISPGELAPSLARGEGYLGFARNGWQETLGVHTTSGAPEQLIVLSRPTYLPLCTALATAAAVLAMLFQFYLLALAAVLVTCGLFVVAGQDAGLARDYGPLPIGHGVSVPPHRGGGLAAVLADGFAWNGKTYPSLSNIALAITGTRWNGPRFFGLRGKAPMEARP